MNELTQAQRQSIIDGHACPHCARRFTVALATDKAGETRALIYCINCHVSRSNGAPFSFTHHINATAA